MRQCRKWWRCKSVKKAFRQTDRTDLQPFGPEILLKYIWKSAVR